MNFAEMRFWGWLGVGLVVIALLRGLVRPHLGRRLAEFDRSALAVLGLFLLACVSLPTMVIFLVVAVCSYFGMRWISRHPPARHLWLLLVLIPIQLSPLLYYKYANFALNQVMGLGFQTLRDLVIPAGISFYSFQMVSFVIDTLVHKAPLPRFLDFLNFASFFPQIVAGPIERRRDLLPQVEQFRFHWSAENIDAGAPWIVAGIFFKLCLADNVSGYFYGQSATNPYVIWMDNLLFGLRIYYDFAGYSLVAVGLGLCFGIKLTLNFRSPYCSTSSVEFWRRWHISLSQWFRDYVYVPMGGGRTSHWVFNVAVVFVVSGIWHGAGWNFMMWGALHGLFLIVNRLWGKNLKTPALLAWAFTNGAALFAWLCFYETRPGMLWAKLKTLLTPAAYSGAAWQEALANRPPTDQFVMACFVGLAGLVLLVEWLSVARKDDPYYYLRRPVVSIGLVLLTIFLAAGKNNAFIYFAF